MIMARRIHSARSLSSHPRPLKTDEGASDAGGFVRFSTSAAFAVLESRLDSMVRRFPEMALEG